MSFWVAPLLAGPFVGSFLGVVIRRLPAGRGVIFARSACESCGAKLAVADLLPLVSYLWLRARCRYCGAPIKSFHILIELAATGVALWAVLAEKDPLRLWLACLLGWSLLALSWIDWERMRLPDALNLPLLLAGLLVTWWLQPDALTAHAAGAALGYVGLRSVAGCYRVLRGYEGLGAGDAKLLATAGAWVGTTPLPLIVLLAALFGLALAGLLALQGRKIRATTSLPFGPCLALAFWIAWLHSGGAAIDGGTSWYG